MRRFALSIGLLVVGFCAGAWSFSSQPDITMPDYTYQGSQLLSCQKDVLQLTRTTPVTTAVLEEAGRYCHAQLHNQGTLNDFQIRRSKFVQQAFDERILLWMVVGITLTGVVLAAIQLVASYRLAAMGRESMGTDGELAIESGKLSMKSSVTGLVILALSFAFFVVFVYAIYKIDEVGTARSYVGTGVQPQQLLGPGVLLPNKK